MAPVLAPAKRLARDLKTLYTQPLPLYYLWADPSNPSGTLTSLDILLAGPPGTPYAGGVFRLHLDIPPTYPTNPPKAFFRTRIFHPNVEPSGGAVCLETLKRDWRPELTLADVLATIACLLIQPNPDSALNEEAGRLIQDGFDRFTQHAQLMTSIHARVPASLRPAVQEAIARGEETASASTAQNLAQGQEHEQEQSLDQEQEQEPFTQIRSRIMSIEGSDAQGMPDWSSPGNENDGAESDSDDYEDKENDASLSPTPVLQSPPLPIRIGVKRPLGDLPTPPAEPEDDYKENGQQHGNENEKNIAANKPAVELAMPSSSSSSSGMKPMRDPMKRQGLAEISNHQLRVLPTAGSLNASSSSTSSMAGMMPPPAKKLATARARVGIRRL